MIWLRNIVVANVITTIAFFELTELERCCCRIEKEKSQLKAESDDLRAQIEHIGKTKVNGLLISGIVADAVSSMLPIQQW